MRFTKENPLRVGTDCSGIEAPIMALKQLKIPFSHEFSSEIDRHCIASIRANYHPKILYDDMMKRNVKMLPDIDLYVCGFPCQPFSAAGKHHGVKDPRGTVFWECLRVIRYKKPTMFVLENVRGLLSIDGGKTFEAVMAELEKLKMYQVDWRVLNTKDYGIPQSRSRVFIVGVMTKEILEWPTPTKLKKPLKAYVDNSDRKQETIQHSRKKMLLTIPKDSCFIDISFSHEKYPNSNRICPCLNCGNGLWCVPFHRYANTKEYLSLQGFPTSFKQTVSDRQLKKQVGNSMSVNVVARILKMLLESVE